MVWRRGVERGTGTSPRRLPNRGPGGVGEGGSNFGEAR